ncbi:MAG: S-layer homology domain-containing protein, partial [Clostridiales bacterium]|nr:S-layer homology domain-containing protein [Clostridiales bacterium]
CLSLIMVSSVGLSVSAGNDNIENDAQLIDYAKNVTSMFREPDGFVGAWEYNTVKYMLADISGDGKNELLAVGYTDYDDESYSYMEVFENDNGKINKIYSADTGGYGGLQVRFASYNNDIYIYEYHYHLFFGVLLQYKNGNWEEQHKEEEIIDLYGEGPTVFKLDGVEIDGDAYRAYEESIKDIYDEFLTWDELQNKYYNSLKYPSEWAKTDIEKAKQYGIIDDTEHYYLDNINREQFAELIVNGIEKALKVSAKADNAFTDTDNQAVNKAYAMGIVTGTGEGIFSPEAKITRQEIATMLYRAIKYAQKATGNTYIEESTDLSNYSDKGSVSEWAKTAVGSLAKRGIIKGVSDTEIAPLHNTTYEQAAILVVRVYEMLK